jgi:hypothetical protein
MESIFCELPKLLKVRHRLGRTYDLANAPYLDKPSAIIKLIQ